MWTLETALQLIHVCQPVAAAHGFALALGGSVLNRGHSDKDLDIVVHERCDSRRRPVDWHALIDNLMLVMPTRTGVFSFQTLILHGNHTVVSLRSHPDDGYRLVEFWFIGRHLCWS